MVFRDRCEKGLWDGLRGQRVLKGLVDRHKFGCHVPVSELNVFWVVCQGLFESNRLFWVLQRGRDAPGCST